MALVKHSGESGARRIDVAGRRRLTRGAFYLAEGEGFEPSIPFARYTAFRVRRTRPAMRPFQASRYCRPKPKPAAFE